MTEIDALERGMILDGIRSIAVGDHPHVVAGVEVYGGDPAPRRLGWLRALVAPTIPTKTPIAAGTIA